MRTTVGEVVRLPDRRTGPALLALGAFAVMAGLPVVLLWNLAAQRPAPAEPIRPSLVAEEAADPQPVWRPVTARHGGFDVDAPRWRPLGQEVTMFRRSDGLAREVFRFGSAEDTRRHAALVVDRGEMAPATAVADLGAVVSDLGLSAAVTANPIPLATKFGAMRTADMTLESEEGSKACLGFALRENEAGIRITGWVCSGGPEIVSRQEASCFVDRLFTVGVRDAAIAGLFARAELSRHPCPAATATTAANPLVSERGGRPAPLRLNRL
ncbi:hypothetical protein [Phreatobacter cathodiphilus]|uniref:hypothetical protein n=1 Tax=Phreatobacter cathodiphilus TaxID=1868589 RepID=UPI0015E65FB2|nr:hypothetical protein [Phreatobacter cathodiphilus]